jgi:hypothetical protein
MGWLATFPTFKTIFNKHYSKQDFSIPLNTPG